MILTFMITLSNLWFTRPSVVRKARAIYSTYTYSEKKTCGYIILLSLAHMALIYVFINPLHRVR